MNRDERVELLAEAVSLARGFAAQYCWADPRSGESCALHHGIWTCARLLALVGSPGADAAFWGRALEPLSHLGHEPRILLSGASDHGFLELIFGLLRAGGTRAELHLLDRCETPLRLNRWYAAQVAVTLHTVQSDILAYVPDRPFDVIGAHAFIDQLPPAAWPALLQTWWRALAPGGRVIALNRLRTEDEASSDRRAALEARDFRPLIERVNARLPARLRLPVEPLAAEVARYWRQRAPTPFRSAAMLVELFERTGFVIECAEEGFAEITGRALSRSRRLRLIARKS